EEPCVLDRDAGLAREHAQKLDVSLVECPLLFAVDGPHAAGAGVENQRYAAERTSRLVRLHAQPFGFFCEMVSNQEWLPGSNHVLGEMVSRRALALRVAVSVDDFQFESDAIAFVIEEGDVKAADVEQP